MNILGDGIQIWASTILPDPVSEAADAIIFPQESGGITGSIAATATSGSASATGSRTVPSFSGTVAATAASGVVSATGSRTVPSF